MSATLTQPADLETRSSEAHKVADVNFAKRIVTVIAMPYERPTPVLHHGRVVTEVCSRSAFDGVEKRAGKIRANRDHSWDKICGKVVALHPSRAEGLVTEVRMFRTPLGDETLTLCDEGGLDASAGFVLLRNPDGYVYDDAEAWDTSRSVRRLNRIRLDHLALVPNPAYEDAVVLDVRNQRRGTQERPGDDGTPDLGIHTPNFDRLALDALRAQRDEMNRRHGVGF